MTTLLPRAGTLARLLGGLTYPHGVEGYRDAFRPAAGAGAVPATVVSITPRTDRARSVLLRPATPVPFVAGQHVLVTCQIAGIRHTRCYSVSDTPHREDDLVEITVAHIPDGRVSTHLTRTARVGETVGLSPAQGLDFRLPDPRPERLLLVGGGSGVTPLRAMWRTMAAEGLADRVDVLYYARTAADAIFADELAEMGATTHLTREGGERFSPTHLAEYADDIGPGTQAFVCGPPGLVAAVAEHLAAADVPTATESFAPVVAPSDPDAGGGVLTFAGAGVTAHDDGRVLLEQAEAAGLTPKSGCRMGICHSCTTLKHAGVVRDVRTGEDDDGGECEVQLCISQAVGDVQLAL